MPFKFKLGRKKSGSPALEASNDASSATSSFRVIPRGGASGKKATIVTDKPLPSLSYHGRKWSEEDTSSSNRASDSTSSTNKSRAYEQNSFGPPDATRMPPWRPDSQRHTTSDVPDTNGGRHLLEMPAAFDSREELGQMFSSPLGKHNAPTQFQTPARYSRYSKIPSFNNSQTTESDPSPASLQSASTESSANSPSLSPSFPDLAPPPPPHKSPPVKIQSFDVMRNVVSPSFSDDLRSDLWDGPMIKRMESMESFTRSGASGDADANIVRNSMLLRRDSPDSHEAKISSPLRPMIAPRQSSLHPPAHLIPASVSTDSSKTPSIASTVSSQSTMPGTSIAPKPSTPVVGQVQPPSNNTTPRAVPSKQTTAESDSDDEPLARTLHRLSSNPRLSTTPAPNNGSRLSVVPTATKRLSTFGNLKTPSIASERPSSDSLRSIGESSSNSPNTQNNITPPSGFAANGPPNGGRMSVVGASAAPPRSPGHSPLALDTGSRVSDDDDDVPLALLPSTNSPVRGRLSDARVSQYSVGPGRPASNFGAQSVAGGRNSLPPFARRLPHDPYGSAEGVLNASRESLLLNRPAHTFPAGQSPVPGMPPGGLVGVIAEEERAKSWRRAAGAGQTGLPALNPGMSMGMQGPMSIPGIGHGYMGAQHQAPGMVGADQTQFNQQLVQLVHQQSMMLQQMQAMMQQQQQYAGSVMGYPEAEYMQQAPNSPGLRPRSMMNSGMRTRSMINLTRPPNAPRTMSMISTGAHYTSNWNLAAEPLISSATSVRGMANGYAPSVAPSERSTIGQPNRYRPVTNPQAANDTQSNHGSYNRSSMANPPVYGPLAGGEGIDDTVARKKKSGFFSAMIHPRGRNTEAQPEEEEDWGSFAQKRRSTMPNALA